jgi:hypothetical protein
MIDAQLVELVAGSELFAGSNELTGVIISLRSFLCLRNILVVH